MTTLPSSRLKGSLTCFRGASGLERRALCPPSTSRPQVCVRANLSQPSSLKSATNSLGVDKAPAPSKLKRAQQPSKPGIFIDDLREFRPAPRTGPEPQIEEYGEDWNGQCERWDRLRDQPDASTAGSIGTKEHGVPVYVMLPLDSVWVRDVEGKIVSMVKRERALQIGLRTLKKAGVKGVMIDIWWGIVERDGPRCYDFGAYRKLFELVRDAGLKVQAVMSFHAAGGNVGDTCKIPLPRWVLDIGLQDPDIFYTDRAGVRNRECLSLGCDDVALDEFDRTPVDMYRELIARFVAEFGDLLDGSVVTELTVGMGPAGEMRYPAYPEGDGRWRFPGTGEFQCYDRYLLADLKRAAEGAGHPDWGLSGPHDAGNYNSRPWETGFFVSQGGSWDTEYGRFFLSWYSTLLLRHSEKLLTVTYQVMNRGELPRKCVGVFESAAGDNAVTYTFEPNCKLGVKLAGVHWWFKSRAHAAELTAGYYNTRDRNGYEPIMHLLRRFNARLNFTCVEMRDCEHPPEGRCSPQGLLQQIIETAEKVGVPLAGENALQRYDDYAFNRIAESAFGGAARAGRLEQLTFLRMGDLMFDGNNWDAFARFLGKMRQPPGQDGK